MKNYVISDDVVNGLLRYLLSRPMVEVERAVYELRNLPQFQEAEEEKDASVEVQSRRASREEGRKAEAAHAETMR